MQTVLSSVVTFRVKCSFVLAALVLAWSVECLANDSATIRFATLNASLSRERVGDLLSDLANPSATNVDRPVADRIRQVHHVAEIIQRINPDVLLINEFDLDIDGKPGASSRTLPRGYYSKAAGLFHDSFLAASHGGGDTGRTATKPVEYRYRYTPNTNTGLASGIDLDNDGNIGGAGDAFGFGRFAGQYGMTIYSKHPIIQVRTFGSFRWKDMPGNLLTSDKSDAANNLKHFYSAKQIDALRMSSKNHVDVAIEIDGRVLHFLVAHPTPPVFDGPEDRNGKRNHDEIRFFKDYVNGATYMVDDAGKRGGLAVDARFVIAGDFNADPNDGDSFDAAILQLLAHPRINTSITPRSSGALEAATWPDHKGKANQSHKTNPAYDTTDFNDKAPGNLRVDYVLPSTNLTIKDAGVFWPTSNDANFPLVGTYRSPDLYAGFASSDHRAVWIDVSIAGD